MIKIILDTNILLLPAQFHIDIFSEIERICHFKYGLAVIDKTLDELGHIFHSQRGKNKEAAKLALQLIRAKDIEVLKSSSQGSVNGHVDEIILALAERGKHVVATLDQLLKRQLKEKKVPMIVMRQRKFLMLYNFHENITRSNQDQA
ncbi:DNA-binding protein [Candidatus Woesearchaeota archaeon]|nr:DNA-binding protein [Candidatus Woesearchaeota archaeon]